MQDLKPGRVKPFDKLRMARGVEPQSFLSRVGTDTGFCILTEYLNNQRRTLVSKINTSSAEPPS